MRGALTLPAMALLLAGCPTRSGGAPPAPGTPDTPDTPEGSLLVAGATLIDATGRQADMDVWVAEGRITAVVPSAGVVPEGALDGRGRFVTPGLVDLHTHLALGGSLTLVGDTLDSNLRATFAAGVTTVVDLGGPRSLYDLRDRLAAAAVPAPRIFASGPFLTAPGSHPCETAPDVDLCVLVTNEAEGAAAGAGLRDAGADLLKVAVADAAFTPWGATPRLDLAALDGVASAGLPVWAHVDTETDALDALAHGASVLAHPPFSALLAADGAPALGSARAVLTTVSAFAAVGRLLDGTLDPADPTLGLTPAQASSWAAVAANPDLLLPGWAAANAGWAANVRANLATLRAAGVVVLPGSDAGYLFVPHGVGLHDELDALVAMGATPRVALAAATAGAHGLLGDGAGTLGVGELADLLLLAGDPDVSITALRTPLAVVRGGVAWTAEGARAADLLADGLAEAGQACLEHADCQSGACDGLGHACAATCPEAGGLVDEACGAGAWCMAADVVSDPQGVCRAEEPCDLYEQDCGPDPYVRACLPYDEDTSACWFGGTRVAGQHCDASSAATACAPGGYCSPVDGRCYLLCDPEGPDRCERPATCRSVAREDGTPWFGLCY